MPVPLGSVSFKCSECGWHQSRVFASDTLYRPATCPKCYAEGSVSITLPKENVLVSTLRKILRPRL